MRVCFALCLATVCYAKGEGRVSKCVRSTNPRLCSVKAKATPVCTYSCTYTSNTRTSKQIRTHTHTIHSFTHVKHAHTHTHTHTRTQTHTHSHTRIHTHTLSYTYRVRRWAVGNGSAASRIYQRQGVYFRLWNGTKASRIGRLRCYLVGSSSSRTNGRHELRLADIFRCDRNTRIYTHYLSIMNAKNHLKEHAKIQGVQCW